MKSRTIITLLCALAAISCTKNINKVEPSNECSVLDIRVGGQLGRAEITRTSPEKGNIEIFVNTKGSFNWGAVVVEALSLSFGATSEIGNGAVLDFYNPAHSASFKVRSQTGRELVWEIHLQPYEPFYEGTWRIEDIKIYIDQSIAGVGEGKWDTSMKGDEFGYYATPEFDNIITITVAPEMVGDKFVGTIMNHPGPDGLYGQFKGIWPGEYSIESPLDMTTRLRHLIPEGEAQWELNLSTNEMKITKNNITSTMTFGEDEWGNMLFNFALPNAASDPAGTNFYDNFWRSSYKFAYIVRKK